MLVNRNVRVSHSHKDSKKKYIPFSDIFCQEINLWFIEHGNIVPIGLAVPSWLRSNTVLQVTIVVGRGMFSKFRTNTADDGHFGEVHLLGGSVEETCLST